MKLKTEKKKLKSTIIGINWCVYDYYARMCVFLVLIVGSNVILIFTTVFPSVQKKKKIYRKTMRVRTNEMQDKIR